jgi:hypothetical protein
MFGSGFRTGLPAAQQQPANGGEGEADEEEAEEHAEMRAAEASTWRSRATGLADAIAEAAVPRPAARFGLLPEVSVRAIRLGRRSVLLRCCDELAQLVFLHDHSGLLIAPPSRARARLLVLRHVKGSPIDRKS